MTNSSNPYVGPRSFTSKERNLFFGREMESRDLLSLVLSERLSLFYAQSGAGKTSLINTALVPGLEEHGRVVLPVGRVGSGLPAGIEEVGNVFVFNLIMHLDQSDVDPALLARLDLSSFLRSLTSADGRTWRYEPAAEEEDDSADDAGPICVLIVDQFEEILTSHLSRWQDRQGFFLQLDQAMADDPKLSVVLSLREDHVAALDPYVPLLADRMRARFHMERMRREAALAAVAQPAASRGRPFAPGAAETLVDNLSLVRSSRSPEPKPGQYVEPVQLQVVCQRLWENLPADGGEIAIEQVRDAGSVDRALADFYEQALAEALMKGDCSSERQLRNWLGRRLITPAGTRGTVFQDETGAEGMDNQTVQLLEDRHLLRAESRSGAVWYELVHDRFVDPILRSNREWLQRQGPLLQDAQAWDDGGRRDGSLLYAGEKLKSALATAGDPAALEPVVGDFLAAAQLEQAEAEERDASQRREREALEQAKEEAENARRAQQSRSRLLLGGLLVVAVLLALAGWQWQKAEELRKTVAAQLAEARRNFGIALNAKAEDSENRGRVLSAHLHSLHALNNLSQAQASNVHGQALMRALANPVPLPILVGAHDGKVFDAVFSPDGRLLASGSGDNKIRIWDARSGALVRVLEGHGDSVLGIAFSTDGRLLASGSGDNKVGIWDIAEFKLLRMLEGHADKVTSVAFSPDGRLLASGSLDRKVGVWDVEEFKLLRMLAGHERSVRSVAFSPDGRTIASGSHDNRIHLWDAGDGSRRTALTGHGKVVRSVAFSPDGRLLASGSEDRTIIIWDVQSGKQVHSLEGQDKVVDVAFSPDSRLLATGSEDRTAALWDVGTGRRLRTFEGHEDSVRSVAFSPDSHTLATGSEDRTAALWDVRAGLTVQFVEGHQDSVNGVVFSPDGRMLVSGSRDKTLALWDVDTGRRLQTLKGHRDSVSSVALSPDGRILASGSWDSSVGIWQIEAAGQAVKMLGGHDGSVRSVAFSPDGRTIVSGSQDRTAALWDVATGQRLRIFKGHEKSVLSVAFSPDGHLLATGSDDRTAVLWDVGTGQQLRTLAGHGDSVRSVAFSPDGRMLATGSDRTAVLWDVDSGQRLRILEGQEKVVLSVAFSPDGHTLATGSLDNAATIWDVATGHRLRSVRGHGDKVMSVAFSPDGRLVAFGSGDNVIGLWDFQETVGTWSGLSQDPNDGLRLQLDGLPYRLEGMDLVQSGGLQKMQQDAEVDHDRWNRRHPLHWLAQAEAGDAEAMLEIALIHDRSNDLANALHWYGQAMQAGSSRAETQRDRLLRWLEDEDNRRLVPAPLLEALCAAREELELPVDALNFCDREIPGAPFFGGPVPKKGMCGVGSRG